MFSGHIPDFDDIKKTSENFLKTTTFARLQFGRFFGIGGTVKLKVYNLKGSKFVRCHEIDSNNEYIHILRPDGCFQGS